MFWELKSAEITVGSYEAAKVSELCFVCFGYPPF